VRRRAECGRPGAGQHPRSRFGRGRRERPGCGLAPDVPGQIQSQSITSPEGLVDYYLGLFVDGDVTPEARQALIDYLNNPSPLTLGDGDSLDVKARGLVHLALATPTYQLA